MGHSLIAERRLKALLNRTVEAQLLPAHA